MNPIPFLFTSAAARLILMFWCFHQMELSKHLREYSETVDTKQQLIIKAFAQAFEVIPRQIADNAGFDATDILNDLRTAHHQGTSSTSYRSTAAVIIFFCFFLNSQGKPGMVSISTTRMFATR